MKILPAKSEPPFKPISVTFVFETQDEIDAMAALFNHNSVDKAIDSASENNEMGDIVSDGLAEAGAKYRHKFDLIVKHISK